MREFLAFAAVPLLKILQALAEILELWVLAMLLGFIYIVLTGIVTQLSHILENATAIGGVD